MFGVFFFVVVFIRNITNFLVEHCHGDSEKNKSSVHCVHVSTCVLLLVFDV